MNRLSTTGRSHAAGSVPSGRKMAVAAIMLAAIMCATALATPRALAGQACEWGFDDPGDYQVIDAGDIEVGNGTARLLKREQVLWSDEEDIGGWNESYESACFDSAGNLLLTYNGYNHQAYVKKIDPDGKYLWKITNFNFNGGNDFSGIAVDSENNVVSAGHTSMEGKPYQRLLVLNENGGVVSDSIGDLQDHAYWDLAVDSQDAIFLLGYDIEDWLVNGTDLLVQVRTKGADQVEDLDWWGGYMPGGINVTRDDEVVVVGTKWEGALPSNSLLLKKYKPNGEIVFGLEHELSGMELLTIQAVDTDSNGEIYVAGHVKLLDGKYVGILLKFNREGALLWTRTQEHAGSVYTHACDVVVDGMNNVTVCCSVKIDGGEEGIKMRVLLVKYDSDGNIHWRRVTEDSDGSVSCNTIAADAGCDLAVAGSKHEGDDLSAFAWKCPAFPYPNHGPALRTVKPADLAGLDLCGFSHHLGDEGGGQVRYQLSPDGKTWYSYHAIDKNGEKAWLTAPEPTGSQSYTGGYTNSVDEVDNHIAEFNEIAGEELFARVFLCSGGMESVVLDSVSVETCPGSLKITPSKTWYLAEGSTGSDAANSFETWVLVANPTDETAHVDLNYMTGSGTVQGPSLELAPGTRQSINVADVLPGTWSVSTVVQSDTPVIAERAVYWNGRQGGHDSVGVNQPSTTWYLAEGSTGSDAANSFETWVLVANPTDETAHVDLNYMTGSGTVQGPSLELAPGTRQSINVADVLPGTWSVSTVVQSDTPVIAERAVYWNGRQGGHDSVGVNQPSTTWYLAEGSTGSDAANSFETWVLVANPTDETAHVDLNYMTGSGTVQGPSLELAPGTRQSINVADVLPGTWSVSTVVQSDTPVIAERAVYWNGRQGGHDSVGVNQPSTTWYLAEGSTGSDAANSFETWVLVANPTDETAHVDLNYMTGSGTVQGPSLELAPGTRQSINVADVLPGTWSVSTVVQSDTPVIAERAVYWNGRQGGHDSVGSWSE